MNSLETTCNILSSQLSNHFQNNWIEESLKIPEKRLEINKNEFVSELSHFQKELRRLKDR